MITAEKCIKHLITITLHKWYVAQECFKRGLYWQGIVHDLSKYSPVEFVTSAKYFQGDRTPIGAEKADIGYSRAWLHHRGRNLHHWEYWVDWCEGDRLLCLIPDKYVVEMACDMIGASKAYNRGKFNRMLPYAWYQEHRDRMLIHPVSKKRLEDLLREYANDQD